MNLRNRKRDNTDIATFKLDLKQVRLEAGDPSYAAMSKNSILTKPTITRMLNGTAIPTWPTVDAFLIACGTTPDEIETVWKPRWAAVKKGVRAATLSSTSSLSESLSSTPVAAEPTVPPGTTCPTCGSWVTDRELHARYHKQYVLRPPQMLAVVASA